VEFRESAVSDGGGGVGDHPEYLGRPGGERGVAGVELDGFAGARIRRAIDRWVCDGIIRSWAETWYQLGLVSHAGSPVKSSRQRRASGLWVVAMTSDSISSRSWQKLSWTVSWRCHRNSVVGSHQLDRSSSVVETCMDSAATS
jgi:hypothetical protein